jgi:hypothetical protein
VEEEGFEQPTKPAAAAAAAALVAKNQPPPKVVENKDNDTFFTEEVVAEHEILRVGPGGVVSSPNLQAMDRARLPVSMAKRLYRVPGVPSQSNYRDHTGRNSSCHGEEKEG